MFQVCVKLNNIHSIPDLLPPLFSRLSIKPSRSSQTSTLSSALSPKTKYHHLQDVYPFYITIMSGHDFNLSTPKNLLVSIRVKVLATTREEANTSKKAQDTSIEWNELLLLLVRSYFNFNQKKHSNSSSLMASSPPALEFIIVQTISQLEYQVHRSVLLLDRSFFEEIQRSEFLIRTLTFPNYAGVLKVRIEFGNDLMKYLETRSLKYVAKLEHEAISNFVKKVANIDALIYIPHFFLSHMWAST